MATLPALDGLRLDHLDFTLQPVEPVEDTVQTAPDFVEVDLQLAQPLGHSAFALLAQEDLVQQCRAGEKHHAEDGRRHLPDPGHHLRQADRDDRRDQRVG